MSEVKPNKSNTNVSSSSSWSIIEESEVSRNNSLENIIVVNDNELHSDQTAPMSTENSPENVLIEIPDTNTLEQQKQIKNTPVTVKHKVKRSKNNSSKVSKTKMKKKKKLKAEPIGLLAIAASLLTITGISLLCMVFPQDNDVSVNRIAENPPEIRTSVTPNYFLEHFRNETLENQSHIGREFLKKLDKDFLIDESIDEEVCPIEEQDMEQENTQEFSENLELNDVLQNRINELIDLKVLRNSTNTIFKGVKDVFSNTNLHVLLCTLLQDICLIKLVNIFNKTNVPPNPRSPEIKIQVKKPKISKLKLKLPRRDLKPKKPKQLKTSSTEPESKNISNSINVTEKSIPKATKKSDKQIIQKINERYNDIYVRKEENGKSECERRFEQLDSQWTSLGQNHRQNIEQIRERFRTEIFFIRNHEKELSSRRKKIEMVRERYLQNLKADRERYLEELRKIRDERQQILQEICYTNKTTLYSKDTGVGNYAVVLPSSYNFQEKLRMMKYQEGSLDTPLEANKTFDSKTELNKLKPKYHSMAYLTVSNESDDNSYKVVKRPRYSENDLKKKKKKHSKRGPSDLIVQSLLSHLISKVSAETVDTLNKNYLNSEDNSTISYPKYPVKESEEMLKEVLTQKRKKMNKDLYEIAFEQNAIKIKKTDEKKWAHEKYEKSTTGPFLSKHDPKNSYKEKVIFKGQQ